MGEVSAFGEAHRKNGVARLEHGVVDGHIGATTAVRLDIGVFGTEQFFSAVDRELFGLVDTFAPVVPAFAGIAFGVFIGQTRPLRFAHGLADNILRGDQLNIVFLPDIFVAENFVHFRIGFVDGDGVAGAFTVRLHFIHAALVAAAHFRLVGQPGFENFQRGSFVGVICAEAEHVGRVVEAREFGHFRGTADGGAHTRELVGRNAHTDPGIADQHALFGLALRNAAGHFGGVIGIIG